MNRRATLNSALVFRALLIVILDCISIAGSYFLALLLRFDLSYNSIDARYLKDCLTLLIPYLICAVLLMLLFRLYQSIWRFASFSELARLIVVWILHASLVAIIYLITKIRLPISVWIMGETLSFFFTTAIRFSYRFLRLLKARLYSASSQAGSAKSSMNIMVVGAGSAGKEIIHEYLTSPFLTDKVVCIIDDDPAMLHRYIDGVQVVGDRRSIPQAVEKYGIQKIIFAIPTASGSTRRDILSICEDTGCKVMVVPGIYQMVDGTVSVSKLRDVDIADLLGRDPVKIDEEGIRDYIDRKIVMVTGGGGSIGSELCRQIAAMNPAFLIIFDIYENNAYDIEQELKHEYGDSLRFITLIGSVRNTNRVNSVLNDYHPNIIFHAAAHKHVPLMEGSPNEAIKNNVIGTYKLCQAALSNGVQKFVLISTDKAVNPTNIMGASKRLCEMVVQMMDRRSWDLYHAHETDVRTKFVAVRFGNVLGSSGSVIPLFKKEIAAGGPVTVTDKRIIRYFMTIPEAVSLVLQAGTYARGGEIFVLDMGEPVKIDDMARRLIRLAGYEPDVDIDIVYTGLRPGEKLFEERLMDEEGLKTTENKLISIAEPIPMDDKAFEEGLRRLDEASKDESEDIRAIVAEYVKTYKY